jgi:hypothetical protein
MMPASTFVQIGAQADGLHHWPNASVPDDYLGTPHRHLFVVTVRLQVFHDDREIEINAAARWLTVLLPTLSDVPRTGDGPIDFGAQSCERLAVRIAEALQQRHGDHRAITVTVLEDGLLGAGYSWQPDPEPCP